MRGHGHRYARGNACVDPDKMPLQFLTSPQFLLRIRTVKYSSFVEQSPSSGPDSVSACISTPPPLYGTKRFFHRDENWQPLDLWPCLQPLETIPQLHITMFQRSYLIIFSHLNQFLPNISFPPRFLAGTCHNSHPVLYCMYSATHFDVIIVMVQNMDHLITSANQTRGRCLFSELSRPLTGFTTWALEIETECFSETSAPTSEPKRRQNSEDHHQIATAEKTSTLTSATVLSSSHRFWF
jgi:hypothetical protein